MKFPSLLRVRERLLAPLGHTDQAERLVVETFRTLSTLCTRLADMVESQRLTRAGYHDQGRFLERLDRSSPSPGPDHGGSPPG
ncbi:MAG TPA: hypothetical protein VFD38_00600 [Myxococcaceae bacterium]|nr:hypothetical protein [Myxococcaceae bacterium]